MRVVAMLCCALLAACSASPKKPTTHTPAPALNDVRHSVMDSKDGITRARTINQQIDNKLSILRDYK